MTKDFWINLPVKDVNKSRAFFKHIGFHENPNHAANDHMASLIIGEKKVVVMLFSEPIFKSFVNKETSDPSKGIEMILSFDAETVEEVDEIFNKAVEAGSPNYMKPGHKDGWMYGCGFCDLDGHQWNILYMDMSKMPR